jgi:hypothetical protein
LLDGSGENICLFAGEGQFGGASGYITSNFTMDESGHVTDNQLGVIYVK